MTTLPRQKNNVGVLTQMDSTGTHTYTEEDLNEMRKKRALVKTKIIKKPVNSKAGKIDLLIK